MPHSGRASGPRPQFLTPMSPIMSPGPSGLKSSGLKSPRPTDLFLKKNFAGNGSTASVNEMPPPPTPTGLRAQLGHLLSRHAHFRTRVVIHQISSVPFVGGEFAVRWKFKGVQTTQGPKQKLLGRAKGRAEGRLAADDLKSPGDGLFSPPAFDPDSTTGSTSKQNPPASFSSTFSSRASDLSDSGHLTTEWGHLAVSTTAASSASSLITTIPTPNLSGTNTPATVDIGNVTPARGMTLFVPLKEHSVAWSQTLDTVLKFDIDRETSNLLQNPLKLVVIQRVVPGDPHGNPQNPRLGVVYLNLSEYVGQGTVTRRYLLKESKTNAVLKLTIELEYLSGETNYIPPSLAKPEILNGIAGYLEKESVKKRPRPLDLYGPYKNQEELETDLLSGLKSTAKVPKTARSERKISNSTYNTTLETETEDDEYHETTSFEETETRGEVNVAFDVQRLPAAYGTKTTEVLIDSLFNPVRVSDKAEESPFTIYDPPSLDQPLSNTTFKGTTHPYRRVGLGLSGITHDVNTSVILPSRQNGFMAEESSSMHTNTSDSASELSHTSSSLHSRSLQHGRLQAHKVMMNARSTPGGRVVVEGQNGHGKIGLEDSTSSSIGVVRNWWRRNISKHNLTTMKSPNQAS